MKSSPATAPTGTRPASSPSSGASDSPSTAAANRAIKDAGRGIFVVSGSLAFTGVDDPSCCQPADRYLEWLYEAGFKDTFDVLGVNANVYCPCVDAAPGTVPGYDHPSFYFRHVEQLREIMVARGDAEKQIWLLEFGWPATALRPSGALSAEQLQGELIVQAYAYAQAHWAPWIGVMSLWTLADPTWNLADDQPYDDEMAAWAITNPEGSTRPAYDRLRQAWLTRELPWQRNGPP